MSQSLSAIYLHLIFSTKGRVPFLHDPILRSKLHAFLGGVSKTVGCPSLIVGGVEDHVHWMVRFSRTVTVSDWVKEVKRVSSIWFKEQPGAEKTFTWQAGYACFSVSPSSLEQVRAYIDNQESHHQKHSFQDELREFFKRHGIEWDERYVWN